MEGRNLDGLTFDDSLLLPGSLLPARRSRTATCLTKKIELNIPCSAAHGIRTESHLAWPWPQGRPRIRAPRNMSIDRQAEEIDRVKRSESGMIVDPVTISPEHSLQHALDLMTKYRVSGLPVTRGPRLVGILTKPRSAFEKIWRKTVNAVMPRRI